jgi:hypothetical protein
MSINSFAEAREHAGHDVQVVEYGSPDMEPLNVAIQCEDCGVVLMDWDNPKIRIAR